MATPCASTVSHASTVTNASAKIVIATIAVETVVVVESIVSRSKKREGMRAAGGLDSYFTVGAHGTAGAGPANETQRG
jgi:hypothetical protein